jgi:hypothetical protein
MPVHDSIFGSKSEEIGYRDIKRTWGDEYAVYPQVPWAQLFDLEPAQWRGTTNFFYQTSVDYVLCKNGRPLLAIDFDGLGRGCDRAFKYVQVEATKDRRRKEKFDVKLRCARDNDFPYHIVSYEEFQPIGETHLTVVDAIISNVLVRAADTGQDLNDGATLGRFRIPGTKYDVPLDIFDDHTVAMNVRHNKFWHKTFQVKDQIQSMTGTAAYDVSYKASGHPALPGVPKHPWDESDMPALWRRITAFAMADWCGCTAVMVDTPVGEVSATFQMRNVGKTTETLTVAQEIADLMVWSTLLGRLRRTTGGKR